MDDVPHSSSAFDRLVEFTLELAGSLCNWEEELEFIDSLIALGPVDGARIWTRDELHER